LGRKPEPGRGERVLPGIWRLRLPLPWPGVPHVNAWALRAGEGVVLVDTGIASGGGMRQLETAMAQVGLEPADVGLVVCTHSHSDHYGLAGPILDEAGCELWMHPAWEHVRASVEEPEATLERRIEVARQSGVPAAALEEYERRGRDQEPSIARLVAPDRELVPGVEFETDHGLWQVHETPGHAPSHVVLHQPGHRLLLSGDHLLGRVSIFYDYGHTPDPVAEFLGGLDVVAGLETDLCLAGHGRPFRGIPAKVEANSELVAEQLERVRGSFETGPRTAFEVAGELVAPLELTPASAAWALQLALAYVDHLDLAGELVPEEGSDPRRWRPAD
jgi:glyoxylase-like metal-dependent hydrolase (beta-lactamase superfamily II)